MRPSQEEACLSDGLTLRCTNLVRIHGGIIATVPGNNYQKNIEKNQKKGKGLGQQLAPRTKQKNLVLNHKIGRLQTKKYRKGGKLKFV